MLNALHLIVLITGIFAYVFSDVASDNGLVNTLLPTLVLFCFIYGLVLSLSLIYRSRNKPDSGKSTDFLLQNMKQMGINEADVANKLVENKDSGQPDTESELEK